ncbi:fatty acid desaturase [Nitrosopumilus cobalaminigenes]|uniref:Fatty acid desaturase n=1 Tax=Nitrosopumilus cobalaminigenes TaxID=1470066 RepID=A0A7D5LZ03_9ARCH|nr:fatty acid desaturase [Nitrosopumilus cobalaminigenes]QLH02673.1 fatty acid desaturase [Nitrosopumilus cobalaminigenes]
MTPQDFVERSDLRGFLALGRDWGAIIATILFSVWANNFFVYLASVWVIGTFQYAIGEVLLHEASHYNLFKSKKINEFSKIFYAFPFLVLMSAYRTEHRDHHYKMNTKFDHIVGDYEIIGLNNPKKNMFWIWFIKPIIGYSGYFFLYDLRYTKIEKNHLQLIFFWIAIIGIFAYFDRLDILLYYWIIPLFWVFSTQRYWSEIAKHYNTKNTTRSDIGWKNHIFHNAGYHFTHHKYPSIPWYKLSQAHNALCADSVDISSGFLDTYRKLTENLNSEKKSSDIDSV